MGKEKQRVRNAVKQTTTNCPTSIKVWSCVFSSCYWAQIVAPNIANCRYMRGKHTLDWTYLVQTYAEANYQLVAARNKNVHTTYPSDFWLSIIIGGGWR